MNIYRYSDYREAIRSLIKEAKAVNKKANSVNLARTIGVQGPYLSKVLNGDAHLSSDQMFGIAKFFQLSEEELEFLLLLLEFARSGMAERKKVIGKKIAAIQLEHKSARKAVQAEFLEPSSNPALADYYLDPYMTIFHQALAVKEFAGSAKKVADHHGISEAGAKKIVQTLEALNLVICVAPGIFKLTKDSVWLAPESSLNLAYYTLFRQASSAQLARLSRQERSIFSITFSADEKARGLLHEEFLKFLRSMETLLKSAEPKEVYQINFDLFPWR